MLEKLLTIFEQMEESEKILESYYIKDPNRILNDLYDRGLFSVTELSKSLKVSRQTVYNYLEGKTLFDLDKIFKLCEAYDISIYLFIKNKEILDQQGELKNLKEEVKKLRFILKNVLDDVYGPKSNFPKEIEAYPQFKALETAYNFSNDPEYKEELERLIQKKKKE